LSEKPTKVSSNINGLQSFFFIYPREKFPEEKLKKLMLGWEILPDSCRTEKSRKENPAGLRAGRLCWTDSLFTIFKMRVFGDPRN